MDIKSIGEIGNYYGGLSVKEEDGLFFWSIDNWDGTTGKRFQKHSIES